MEIYLDNVIKHTLSFYVTNIVMMFISKQASKTSHEMSPLLVCLFHLKRSHIIYLCFRVPNQTSPHTIVECVHV